MKCVARERGVGKFFVLVSNVIVPKSVDAIYQFIHVLRYVPEALTYGIENSA